MKKLIVALCLMLAAGYWNFAGTDPSAEAVERVSLGCNFAGTDPSAEGVGKVSLG